jgi:hypothetical protein
MKFAEITQDVQKLAQLLTLSASVDVQNMLSVQYKQSEDLKAKIDSMGGAHAMLDNDEAFKEVLSSCSASEQLMHAHAKKSSDALHKSQRISECLVEKSNSMIAQADEKMIGMQKQLERLTSYLTNIFEAEVAEPSREAVREFMEKRPVKMNDDAQEKVRADVGLAQGNLAWHGNKSLKRIASHMVKAFDIPFAWMATIDNDEWVFLTAVMRLPNDTFAYFEPIVGVPLERALSC